MPGIRALGPPQRLFSVVGPGWTYLISPGYPSSHSSNHT